MSSTSSETNELKKNSAEEDSEDMEGFTKDYGSNYTKVIVAAIRAKAIVREAKAKGLPYAEVSMIKPKHTKPTMIALEELEAGLLSYRVRKGSSIGNLRDEAEKRQRNREALGI